MEEQARVRAAMAGDREAFGRLVQDYQRALVASAYHIVGQADDAQDLAQEALVEAFRRLPTLHDPEKFRPWLFVILRNKCLRHLQRRRPTVPLDSCEELAAAPLPDHAIADYLQHLPLADREVLAARYVQELDYADIAEALGITVSAAHMRCSRARERLRAIVRQAEEAETRRLLLGVSGLALADLDPAALTHRVMQEVQTMTQSATLTSGGLAATLTLPAVKAGLTALAIGKGVKIAAGVAAVVLLLLVGATKIPITPGGGTVVTLLAQKMKAHQEQEQDPVAVNIMEQKMQMIWFCDEQGNRIDPSATGEGMDHIFLRDFCRDVQGNFYVIQSTMRRAETLTKGKGYRLTLTKTSMVKYDDGGKRLWEQTLTDAPVAGFVNAGTSLFLLCSSDKKNVDTLVRFSLDGRRGGKWSFKPDNGPHIYRDLAIDPQGHLIVSGTTMLTFAQDGTLVSSRPAASGQLANGGQTYSEAGQLTIGPDGSRYVFGEAKENQDQALVKLSPDGTVIASWRLGNTASERLVRMTVDASGNVWVGSGIPGQSPVKVFSPTGSLLRSVSTDSNVQCLEVGDDGTLYSLDMGLPGGVLAIPPAK